MQINRELLENSLFNYISSDNGLIIGPPGIGKTYLLKEICCKFRSQNIPYFYLPIDKFDVEDSDDLAKVFSYKGDFIKGLKNHPEVQNTKGFLIIDSFDSAKSEKSKKFYLNFIERVIKELKDRWQVVVSVRTFDAKKSQKLLELFPLSSAEILSEYRNSDIFCRHFLIPELTDCELRDILSRTFGGVEHFFEFNTEIWDLLKNPFNLWLLEQIFLINHRVEEFQKIRSQVELLDFFWKIRVHDTPLWEEKEIILCNATQKMVELKKLFVKIENIYPRENCDAWQKLLSDQILIEISDSNQKIAFSHNILFDFAVSLYFLNESENTLFSILSEDISHQLFLRPSIDFYLTRLWYFSPNNFWGLFWKILRSNEKNHNIFLRLTLINVIVFRIEKIDDLNPIFVQLDKGDYYAIKAIIYVLQSLAVQKINNENIWLDFLEKASIIRNEEIIGNISGVLSQILDQGIKNNNLINIQKSGKIGRLILTWILEKRTKIGSSFLDYIGANWIVPIVAKTFRSDPRQSVTLLSTVLEIKQEPNFPIMYIYRLVNELKNIWPYDQLFIGKVYYSILNYQEISKEKTAMGTPVLPLSSNRRQDYEMCQYLLVQQYPKFLIDISIESIKIAIVALNQYIIQNHIAPDPNPGYCLENIKKNLILNSHLIQIYFDGCYIWDSIDYSEESIKIADELFKYIENQAKKSNVELIDEIIDIFCENVKVSFFWRRLLIIAAKYPNIFAEKLFDLCISDSVLVGEDTIKEIGDFIQKISRIISPDKLLLIETSIIDIPKNSNEDSDLRYYLEKDRDRLLSRIPKDLLQSDEGIQIRILLEKRNTIHNNEPLVKYECTSFEYSDEDNLRRKGADFSDPLNIEIVQLFPLLKTFSEKWLNETPDLDSINEIFPDLIKIYDIIENNPCVDIVINTQALTYITSCISEICYGLNDSDISRLYFCRDVLIKAANHPEPVFDSKYHTLFDSPSWSPFPRTEAAKGLPKLASIIHEPALYLLIKKLAIDDLVPAIRYLSTSHILLLWNADPNFVWEISEEIIKKENISTILFTACKNVGKIFSFNEERAENLIDLVFYKTIQLGKINHSNPYYAIIVKYSILKSNKWAISSMQNIANDPKKYGAHFGYLVFELFRYIDPKKWDESRNNDDLCKESIIMLDLIITSTQMRINEIISNINKNEQITHKSELNELYSVIHEVVLRFNFAIEIKNDRLNQKIHVLDSNKNKEKLYRNFKLLLEKIINFLINDNIFNYNAQTLHYLIQIFNEIIYFDTVFVIRTLANLLKDEKSDYYSSDPLAIDEILKFGEKIISDYKEILQDDELLNDFMVIIDSFVKNGDKKMIQFVTRLDEIYR